MEVKYDLFVLNKNKEKLIISLLSLLILFFCTFVVALIALRNGHALFNIGIPFMVENWFIILLSVIFIVKILYELVVL
jgi:hypothetical protein